MMALGNVFVPITADDLMASVSDFAFRVYCMIFIRNFKGQRSITDRELADDFRRSIITVNRAVAELKKADMIKCVFINNRRNLTIKRPLAVGCGDAREQKIIYNGVPDALQSFFAMWGKKDE
jgi:hypothetical protein